MFYPSAFAKKQSAFGTATLLVNYILLKSELVRVFGGKWPFRHSGNDWFLSECFEKRRVLCIFEKRSALKQSECFLIIYFLYFSLFYYLFLLFKYKECNRID